MPRIGRGSKAHFHTWRSFDVLRSSKADRGTNEHSEVESVVVSAVARTGTLVLHKSPCACLPDLSVRFPSSNSHFRYGCDSLSAPFKDSRHDTGVFCASLVKLMFLCSMSKNGHDFVIQTAYQLDRFVSIFHSLNTSALTILDRMVLDFSVDGLTAGSILNINLNCCTTR